MSCLVLSRLVRAGSNPGVGRGNSKHGPGWSSREARGTKGGPGGPKGKPGGPQGALGTPCLVLSCLVETGQSWKRPRGGTGQQQARASEGEAPGKARQKRTATHKGGASITQVRGGKLEQRVGGGAVPGPWNPAGMRRSHVSKRTKEHGPYSRKRRLSK